MLRPLQKKKMLRVCQLRCQGVPPGGVAQIGLSRLSSSEPTICLASTHRRIESVKNCQRVAVQRLQMLQASLLGRMENPELQSSPMRWVEYSVGVSSQREMTCSINLITCQCLSCHSLELLVLWHVYALWEASAMCMELQNKSRSKEHPTSMIKGCHYLPQFLNDSSHLAVYPRHC